MSGRDEVVIHTILDGRSRLDHGKASHRYQSGDAYVASCPRVDFTCHTHEVRTRTITLPHTLLTEVASVTPDPPSRPWEFVPFAPVTGGIRPWRNITHRQLQAADPDHDSVTAVAYRWGFSSPSRFATYYRRAYGVPPSQTLRN
jgi:AraC-like DNA-binding protein